MFASTRYMELFVKPALQNSWGGTFYSGTRAWTEKITHGENMYASCCGGIQNFLVKNGTSCDIERLSIAGYGGSNLQGEYLTVNFVFEVTEKYETHISSYTQVWLTENWPNGQNVTHQ